MGKTSSRVRLKGNYPFLEASPEKTGERTGEKTGPAVYLRVHVQPRASSNSVAGLRGEEGDSLKIRLTAPPVEGEANRALIDFLSRLLGVKKSQVELKEGKKSRTKRVLIKGVSLEEVAGALTPLLKRGL